MTVEIPGVEAADELADLWVDLAADQRAHGSHLLADDNRATAREQLTRQLVTGNVRIAREDDRIVGFVTFDLETGGFAEDAERGFVENLYVVPDRRGEGIGTELLRAAVEALGDGGADAVALEMLADNEAARRFYRRHGFEPHRVELEAATDTLSRDDG